MINFRFGAGAPRPTASRGSGLPLIPLQALGYGLPCRRSPACATRLQTRMFAALRPAPSARWPPTPSCSASLHTNQLPGETLTYCQRQLKTDPFWHSNFDPPGIHVDYEEMIVVSPPKAVSSSKVFRTRPARCFSLSRYDSPFTLMTVQ